MLIVSVYVYFAVFISVMVRLFRTVFRGGLRVVGWVFSSIF